MAAFAKHHIHQAGNKFNNKIQNSEHGAQLIGNFNVGGSLKVQTYEKSIQERLRDCRNALHSGCSDPWDDRDKIVAVKAKRGRIITAHCEWITTHPLFESWENMRTSSQLLWISSVEERGKTMMAIHLSKELEKAARQTNDSTVLYFFIDRQDKRDTAVHVLRGLLTRLTKAREELTKHLLEEYDVQKEALFSKDAIEALWRVFVKMVTDPIAGQVYCIIDGLDYCTDESLQRLVSRITNFFLDEPQTVVDDGLGTNSYSPFSSVPGSAQRRSGQRRGAGLKMILVSREKPEWMVDQLSDFPRIDIGVRGRKFGASSSQSAPKSARRPPTLASVAASVMRKHTMDRSNNPEAGALQNVSENSQAVIRDAFSPSNNTSACASGSTQPPTSVQNAMTVTTPPAITSAQTGSPYSQALPAATALVPQVSESTEHANPKPSASSKSRNSHGRAGAPDPSSSQPMVFELDATFYPPQNEKREPVPAPPQPPEPRYFNGPPQYDQHEDATGYGDEKKVEEEEIEEDYGDPALRLYIEAKLEEFVAERQCPTEIQSYIIAALEHRGDETFLWVDFAVEEIRKVDVTNIEAVLNTLPPTLTEMYSFILLNIPPNLLDLVARLLRWTVCARRPLDVLELTVALNLTQYSSDEAMNIVLTAVYTCGNMLTVSSEDGTVNVVHSSLVDFLSDESSPIHQDPRLARFIIRAAQADSDIANFCIAYLEAGCCDEGSICLAENPAAYNQRLAQYPFMPYAASFWPDHFRDAGNPYLDLSSPFFQSKSKIRKNWWQTYWGFSSGKGTWVAPMNFTLLHLASYLDLVCIAQQMLQRGDLQARMDKRDSHGGSALDYAVERGHMDMFRYLIGVGASQKSLCETLLELACRKGQREIAAALIDMGYNVNVRAQTQSAKESAYLMARWLPGAVSQGLELNRDAWSLAFRDIGDQETPLAQAATYGHSAVIELLLDRGAIIDAATTKGFTPLHAASYQGQTECVQILIKRGATVMAQTMDRWLALHFAALRGKLPVVETFLDMGVPLESMTIKSKTALHLAAYSGHAEVVRALVDRGANLELRSHKGETPLHLATRHGKPQVVELLVSLGANRCAVTNEGKTPLNLVQASATIQSKECMRILQTFGMEGYQPWQPPAETNAAAGAAETVPAANIGGTTGTKQDFPREDSVPSVPSQRPFAPVVAPFSYPIQGFQAELTLNGHYVPSQPPAANVYTPVQPMNQHPPPVQPMNQCHPLAQQPIFNRMQSDPTHGPSRFGYDSNATTQGFQAQQYPQDSAPPPYAPPAPGSGFQMPSSFSEKSSSATMPGYTWNQAARSNSASAQTSNVPSAGPMQSQSQYSTPTTANVIQPTAPNISQQPTQARIVPMMNSLSLNPNHPPSIQVPMTPMTPNQGPAQHGTSLATSPYSQPGYFGTQNTSTSIPTTQTPITPISPPVHPAFTQPATPFQASSLIPPPPTPHHQQNPQQYPPQHGYQAAPSLQQPQHYHQPQQSPIKQPQQFQQPQQPFQTPTPTAYPPSPYLTPTPQQQAYSPQPVQSAQFTGNSTASTYNGAYQYNAPPIAQPYNQGINTNGMNFAPPPTQAEAIGKRKSFLGGLMR